jgi:hypothetical protein
MYAVLCAAGGGPTGESDNNLLTMLTFDKYQLFLDGLLIVSFGEGVFQGVFNNGKMPG